MTTDFIYGDHISDLTIDNLLEFWDNCTYLKKVNGEFSDGVDPTIKKSVDMAIPPFLNEKAVRIFLGELQTVLDKYLERFPYACMAPVELMNHLIYNGILQIQVVITALIVKE